MSAQHRSNVSRDLDPKNLHAIEIEKKKERDKMAEKELVARLGGKLPSYQKIPDPYNPANNNLPPLHSGGKLPPKQPPKGNM